MQKELSLCSYIKGAHFCLCCCDPLQTLGNLIETLNSLTDLPAAHLAMEAKDSHKATPTYIHELTIHFTSESWKQALLTIDSYNGCTRRPWCQAHF